jgi:hypothetical protein
MYSSNPARRFFFPDEETSNPIPAAMALLSGSGVLGKLGKRMQSRQARDAQRFAQADALAQRAAMGDTAALKELTRLSQQFATQAAKDYAAMKLAEIAHAGTVERTARAERAGAAAEAKQARREAQLASIAGTGLQALASRGRSLRGPARRRRRSTRNVSRYS